jgi:hypothetical protein
VDTIVRAPASTGKDGPDRTLTFEPNLSPEQMRALLKAEDSDPLRPFGEACRAELKALRADF